MATRSEKKDGSSRGIVTSRSFQNFVSNTGALDLGFIGPKFTWSNQRVGWANVKERLDRELCNDDWQRLFPKAGIRHLMAPNSDHNPILLDTHLDLYKGIKPFRFEAMWARDKSSVEIVDQAWALQVEGSHGFCLSKRFQKVQKDLVQWNKYFFGATRTRIKELEEKITKIQNLDPTQENLALEAFLSAELNEWLEREELKWRQKSRELWLKEGDRNSKFFHLSTIVCRRRNQIIEIQLEDGSWIHLRDNIVDYFAHHFAEVFQSSSPQVPPDLEGLISPCISANENFELTRILNAEEIKKVVWDMNPLKAPGPDGFPGLFFRRYWDIVGYQVIDVVQSFFREGWLLKQMNHTFITLIPKKQGACNFNHSRPISLCNFYYKIISKILVLRLRLLLAKLIDPSQAAFIPDRWIAENVVLA